MPKGVHTHIFAPNERQKRAHYEQNQNRLQQFPYRCTKELTRAFKLVKGLREQRASKLVKNIKTEGPEKDIAIDVLTATKTMPLDILVRVVLVEDLNLKDDAVGLELAKAAATPTSSATPSATPSATSIDSSPSSLPSSSSTSSSSSSTSSSSTATASRSTRFPREIILQPLTKRQRGMVKKWRSDTRIKDVVTSLSKIRVELKSKVRHMRDRLSKKAKREAIKKDPSLKPVKRPKPVTGLAPQSALYKQMLQDEGLEGGSTGMEQRADYYVPVAKKKKNRMGQRARKKLAQEVELAKERGSNRKQRRATAAGEEAGPGADANADLVRHENRKIQRRQEQQSDDTLNQQDRKPAKIRRVHDAVSSNTQNNNGEADPSSHPSWQARSLAKEKEKNATFTGSKMQFDSDSD